MPVAACFGMRIGSARPPQCYKGTTERSAAVEMTARLRTFSLFAECRGSHGDKRNRAPVERARPPSLRREGSQGGPGIVQQGNANGVKVRRAMQLTRDLATQSFDKLRILDSPAAKACTSIEAALRGAEVIAIDGRNERMDEGQRIASEAGLTRLKFELNDIRHVSRTTHGLFDVVYFLGILYHLDSKDAFAVLENIRDMLTGFIIIDTHIALQGELEIDYRGRKYSGSRNREHQDTDSEAVRRSRLLMSLDNPFSFWFTKESLVRPWWTLDLHPWRKLTPLWSQANRRTGPLLWPGAATTFSSPPIRG